MASQRNSSSIRVIVADDHPLVREGLVALLRGEGDIEVVAEVECADDLSTVLGATPCDVLLLDLMLDRWMLNDIEFLRDKTRVVVLTGSDQLEDLVAAFHLGALGVVRKTAHVNDVLKAIRAVAGGSIWIPPTLHRHLTDKPVTQNQLTTREAEIVRHVATGLRNAEIADKLAITEGTVKIHLNNVFQKLGIRDRVELTLYAVGARLITLPSKLIEK